MTIEMQFPEKLVISYDPEADAAYIRVREGKATKTREEVSDSVIVDLNVKGELLGIEVLRPSGIKAQSDIFQKLADKFHVPVLKRLHPEALPKVYIEV